jgi:hypothetical protein
VRYVTAAARISVQKKQYYFGSLERCSGSTYLLKLQLETMGKENDKNKRERKGNKRISLLFAMVLV